MAMARYVYKLKIFFRLSILGHKNILLACHTMTSCVVEDLSMKHLVVTKGCKKSIKFLMFFIEVCR